MITQIFNKDRSVIAEPYPHIIVDNFFDERTVLGIEQHFLAMKDLGLVEKFQASRLARFPSYDAYCYVFPRHVPKPLDLFISPEWRDYLSEIFGMKCTRDIVAEYHHHKEGSKSGVSHTDYIECFFTDKPHTTGMNPWHFECNYTGGNPSNVRLLSRVRAIAFLYYFGNTDWKEGDGGETEIADSSGKLFNKVAPIHNRLFAFEVSPRSFHRFVQNVRSDRNTVIGWLHMKPEDSVNRFRVGFETWDVDTVNGKKGDSLNVS